MTPLTERALTGCARTPQCAGEFLEGMRARVQTDDEHLERFDVTKGLWQGYVLSPLLFNIIVFDVVMHAVLVRFIQF